MKRKRLMVLGITNPQVPAIMRCARALGYEVVSCVYQPDELVAPLADITYVIDLYDVKALLNIAQKESVSGVIAVGDTLVHSANSVARELGLPGNDVTGIDELLSKRDFRHLQQEVGVFAPDSCSAKEFDDFTTLLRSGAVPFPVVIKPEASSASRGTEVVESFDEKTVGEAFVTCQAYSRSGVVCAEQFIENCRPGCILEIDAFVLGSEILWDGMRYCHHHPNNPALPLGDTYDVMLSDDEFALVRDTVAKVLAAAGFVFGEANIESYFTPAGEYFIVEINPRQAGCYNPQNILQHCGVDLTKLLVSTAVGDMSYWDELKDFERLSRHTASYTIVSDIAGIYDGLFVSPKIASHVVTVRESVARGDKVRIAQNACDNIAYALFDFDSQEQMHAFMSDIHKYIYPVLA